VVKLVDEEVTTLVVDNERDCSVETENKEVCKLDRFAGELNEAVVSIEGEEEADFKVETRVDLDVAIVVLLVVCADDFLDFGLIELLSWIFLLVATCVDLWKCVGLWW